MRALYIWRFTVFKIAIPAPEAAEFNLLAVSEVKSILLLVKIRLFIEVVKLASANNPLQSGWSQRQTVALIMLTRWLEQSWLTAGALLHLRLVTETEMKDLFLKCHAISYQKSLSHKNFKISFIWSTQCFPRIFNLGVENQILHWLTALLTCLWSWKCQIITSKCS